MQVYSPFYRVKERKPIDAASKTAPVLTSNRKALEAEAEGTGGTDDDATAAFSMTLAFALTVGVGAAVTRKPWESYDLGWAV